MLIEDRNKLVMSEDEALELIAQLSNLVRAKQRIRTVTKPVIVLLDELNQNGLRKAKGDKIDICVVTEEEYENW